MNAHAHPSRLEPGRAAVRDFLDAIFRRADEGTFILLRAFDDTRRDEQLFINEAVKVGSPYILNRVCARISQAANHSIALVFCPPVATFRSASRATTKDLANGVALSVDCDSRPAESLERLTALVGTPTVVVASGGEWANPETAEVEPKLHLHWRLREPTRKPADHALLREARQLAAKLGDADATGIALVHPFRWPGSWHRKGSPRLARILSATENEINLDEALDALRTAFRNHERARAKGGPFGSKDQSRTAEDLRHVVAALAVIPNADLAWDGWNRIGMATWLASLGQGFAAFDGWSQKSRKYDPAATTARWRHYSASPPDSIGAGTLFYLAAQAMPGWRRPSAQNKRPEQGRAAGAEEQPGDAEPQWAEGEQTAGSGPQSGTSDDEAEPANAGIRELPVIEIVAGEIPRMVDQAEAALIGAESPIFTRGSHLVRPITETVPAAKGRLTTIAKFRELCRESLIDSLSSVAQFQRFDARSSSWKPADPPGQVAQTLLVREGRWRFPRVAGVITTPTLRADGSILTQAGYDPATRLFLAPDQGLSMPAVAEQPTRSDAEAALRLLTDILASYPFVSPVDRAVALSGIITAVVRGALPAAPMHVIRAHTPGTGKSHLVDVAAAIATGRFCPVIAAGRTAEETEKRLGALLRDGVPIISIDNATGELGGDMLCQITERPLVRIRILGQSEAPEFECKATVFATGNNVVLLGDMTRRAVLCNLDAGVERPELRAFAFDPTARVMERRGDYVAAIITIARAYRSAGSPAVCKAIGSYGEWSDMVCSPLVWLGEADPIDSMETARGEDPELASIREVFGHWRDHLQIGDGERYTANRISTIACEKSALGANAGLAGSDFVRPEFRDVLLRIAGEGGNVSTRRLGRWCSKISGRIVNGYKLIMQPDSSNGSRFSLVEAKGTGRDASASEYRDAKQPRF